MGSASRRPTGERLAPPDRSGALRSSHTFPRRYPIEVTVYDAATCPVTVTRDNTVVGGDGLVNPGIPVSPLGRATPVRKAA